MSEVELGLVGIGIIVTFELIVLCLYLKVGRVVTKGLKWFIRTKVDRQ